jgi:hypothetical protein
MKKRQGVSDCHSNRWMPPPRSPGPGFMDPGLPGGLKPQVRPCFPLSAAVARSTLDQGVSTRAGGGLVSSQEDRVVGPGPDGLARAHAPCVCHPGVRLVPGPGCAWVWCWTAWVVAWVPPGTGGWAR